MKRALVALILTLGTAWAAPATAAIDRPPVRVETGLVAGSATKDPNVTAFRGLPYAAPPVGDLRWRAPEPPKAWDGVRPADKPGPVCAQPQGQGGAARDISEDCLNLDVWTAAKRAGEKRPVMVWFHGGNDGFGAGSSPQYDGEGLAKKGAVVVTVNFRGGPFSQFALPELSKESGHGSGAYGLLDDFAALKWVQRNIAAFGGDPANVTIFGQSFGAGTEQFLTASPLAKGLFQKVIFQSHARYERDPEPHTSGYRTLKQAEAEGLKFQASAGAKSIAELRALPWQKVLDLYRADVAARGAAGVAWTYIQDGYVFPRSFAQIYAAGAQVDVAVLAGDNRDETGSSPDTGYDLMTAGDRPRVNFPAVHTIQDYTAESREKFGRMADELFRLYPATSDREAFLASSAVARDSSRFSTWLWAASWNRKVKKPVYLYYWTHAPPGPNRGLTGAAHGSEIAYVYNRPGAAWTDEDKQIADRMSSYWVNFARTGNPNGAGLPPWPAFDGKAEQAMELGGDFKPLALPGGAKADFWRRFYASQPAN